MKLEKLLDYYKYSLQIEHLSSISIPMDSLSKDPFRLRGHYYESPMKSIQKKWQEAYHHKNKNKRFYFSHKEMVPKTILMPGEAIDGFSDGARFFETAYQLNNTAPDQPNITESENETTDKTDTLYSYFLSIGLCTHRKKQAAFAPVLITIEPDFDSENPLQNAESHLDIMKRIIGGEYKKDKGVRTDVIVNPKFIDTFFSEDTHIETSIVNDDADPLTTAVALFKEIVSHNGFKAKDAYELKDSVYLIASAAANMNFGFYNVHDNIVKKLSKSNLLYDYFNTNPYKLNNVSVKGYRENKKENTVAMGDAKRAELLLGHWGAFDNSYALTPNQRNALAAYLSGTSILPVNGAPGTGKTSLLRAIIGDYAVKAALESYETFKKEGRARFKTPIISSSTNNQALHNVSESIADGYKKIVASDEENRLYQRWLRFSIEFEAEKKEEDNADEDIPDENDNESNGQGPKTETLILDFAEEGMMVPMIRSKNELIMKKTPIYVFNRKLLATLLVKIEESKTTIAEKWLDIAKQAFADITIPENTPSSIAISKAAEFLYGKLKKSAASLSYVSPQEAEIIHELNAVESSLIIPNHELYKRVLPNIEYIDGMCQTLKRLGSQQRETEKKIKAIEYDFSDAKKRTAEIKRQKEALIVQIDKKIERIPGDVEALKPSYRQAFIDSAVRDHEAAVNAMKRALSLWQKILVFIGIGRDHKRIRILNEQYKDRLTEADRWVDKKLDEETGLRIEEEEKTKKSVHEERDAVIADFEEKKRGYETELKKHARKSEKLAAEIKDTRNDLSKLHDNLTDTDAFIEFAEQVIGHERSGLRDKVNAIHDRKNMLDVTDRTDNFYIAMHLAEAVMLLDTLADRSGKAHPMPCPACKNQTFKKTDAKTYKCSNDKCGMQFKFDQEFNRIKTNDGERALSHKEIEQLLEHGFIEIGGTSYCLKEDKSGEYLNITEHKNPPMNGNIFNKLLPLFPVLNVTCNSFGITMGEKSLTQKRRFDEGMFDLMLIDEAATITLPKMLNLYAAKRAIFFGDEYQLNPIYPYNTSVERSILNNFFDGEEDKIKTLDYFSAARRSSMDVSNHATSFFFPYTESKLEGDIWLKEHFRCREDIAEIANALAYSGEMKLQKNNSKKFLHLRHVEHGFNEFDNANIKEAEAIVAYIYDHRDELQEICENAKTDEEYFKSIGIITPFRNQEYEINRVLKQRKIDKWITAGTVHKFQGSERDIIFFSTVYNKNSTCMPSNFFFNRESPNMMNVALTRAKELFITFGHMASLNSAGTYSNVLMSAVNDPSKGAVESIF